MKDSPALPSGEGPLLPFEGPCISGTFVKRVKRFSVALETGAKRLLIGHFSSRNRDASLYEAEGRTVFPETFAVSDGDVFEI